MQNKERVEQRMGCCFIEYGIWILDFCIFESNEVSEYAHLVQPDFSFLDLHYQDMPIRAQNEEPAVPFQMGLSHSINTKGCDKNQFEADTRG